MHDCISIVMLVALQRHRAELDRLRAEKAAGSSRPASSVMKTVER